MLAAAIALPGVALVATSASALPPPTIARDSGYPLDFNNNTGAAGSGITSVDIPGGSVGDLVLVSIDTHIVTAFASGDVTSNNATGWHLVTHVEDATHPRNLAIWEGRVATAGADTIFLTYSGTVTDPLQPYVYTEISVDELSSSVGAQTTWTDVTSGHLMVEPSGTAPNVAFPSLTSSSLAAQAYWGFGSGNAPNNGGPVPGTFTATLYAGLSDNLTIFNAALATGMTYAPTSPQTPDGDSTAVAVIVGVSGLPGPPTIGTAMPGVTSASVAFTPGTTGGTSPDSYTATALDSDTLANGGQTGSSATSPITVSGLTVGDHYTFTVTAHNSVGTSAASGPSNSVIPVAPSGGGSPPPPPPTPTPPVRVFGADRFGTAIAASTLEFPTTGSAGAVVLARSDDYPDALIGAALAKAKNAPLLFANGGSLTPATTTEIQRVLPAGGTVYILGGTTAVPASVATTLTSLGFTVVRYSGSDRYATALAVAGALGNPGTVLLATGINFPDALAAGPGAAHVGGVVLLTDGSTLPASVRAYLLAHPGTVYAVGGPAAAADPSATPLSGADRYATAVLVAGLFTSPTTLGVASGITFPDALSGGAFEAHFGGALLLSAPGTLPTSTSAYLTGAKDTIGTTNSFGGTAALSATVQNEISTALGL